jgi:hypothetical protein
MGAKGRPNRAEMGLGWSAQAGRPGTLRGSVRPPFPCTRRIFNPKVLEVPPFAGPAGLAHSGGRFGPPFLAPEGSSTLKSWRCRHSQGEPFTPGGHPQARERGGRSPEEDHPSRRKHLQVEKKEDTVRSVTMINGATSSTLMG